MNEYMHTTYLVDLNKILHMTSVDKAYKVN